MLSQEKRADLRRILSKHPQIEAAFLFGSQATNRARPDSDVDIGIVTNEPDPAQLWQDLLTDCVIVGIEWVDFVFIGEGDVIMAAEVVRPNQLLYAKQSFDKGLFISKIIRLADDLRPHLVHQQRAIKRSFNHGRRDRSTATAATS